MTDPKTSAAVKSTEEKRRILEEMLRRRAGESRSYPLSFAQQRLWFLDRMEPGSAAYVLVSALRLEGRLRRDALEGALRALAARHASLRTTFSTVGGEPVQVVAPAGDLPLAFEELSAFPEEERRERVLERLAVEAARPFDLARGPLVRATLLRVSEEEHALAVAMHHVVTDGWSMGVLFGELAALYDAAVAGLDAGLPPLPVQYPDYAAWQRKHLAGETLERQLAWWRAALAGAPALLHLPTDRPRPPVPSQRGGHRPVTVPAALTDRLRALAHGEGATLFMAVLAAFGALLARWTGEEELVVGTPVAGRTRPELEGLIGFFVNTLALRADLSGDPPFRELLRRTREATLGAFSHQEVPFEKLVEELRVERSLSHSPLFQVMFTLQSGAAGAPAMTGLRTAALRAPVETARFDLELSLWEHPGGMQGVLGYAADLFDDVTAGRMVEHLGVLLESAAADPDARLSRLAVLPGAERRRLLVEWNDTARPYPVRPVHELIAEQAAATPHAVALVAGDAHLTYAGLDALASRLAARLRAAGVAPEVPVGVCLERGPGMLAAVLGVMKAGGAYVPLDPEYPAERLRFVLEDAGVRVLVAEEGSAGRVAGFGGTVVSLGTPLPRPLPHKGG
ncbi:MAG TPA: condensation domain-containing protein, partial [Longimicrobiaceae bacterium]